MRIHALALTLVVSPWVAAAAKTPTPTPSPSAASLADAVRKAKGEKPDPTERKKSLGVITNETLKGGTPTPGKKGSVTILPGTTAAPGPAPSAYEDEQRDAKGRTERDWRNLVASTERKTADGEAEVRRLEAEVRRLENDFYAWDDGKYRDEVIRPSWDKAKEDLQKARLRAENAKSARAELEDEARKSGAPPGWLRGGGVTPGPSAAAPSGSTGSSGSNKGSKPGPAPTPEPDPDN